MAFAVLALVGLALMSTPNLALTLPILALLGVGLGLFTPANNSSIMAAVPTNRLGIASGILNMTRSVGTSLGVAATGAILTVLLSIQLGRTILTTQELPPEALRAPFHESLLFLAGLALLAAALSATRTTISRARVNRAMPQNLLAEPTGL
jgi:hypothetical protein